MKTTPRFEQAIQKLYTAFHKGSLIPESCTHCAVGNICDNTEAWANFTNIHGSVRLNYIGVVHQNLGRKYFGYSPIELLQIEAEFLKACGFSLPLKGGYIKPKLGKDILFKGLTAVVSFLCQLDQLPDVMDCSKLFNYTSSDKFNNLEAPVL